MTLLSARAAALDADDPFAETAALFHKPDGVIYLDGNSLGMMPRATAERVAHTVHAEWSEGLIRSWAGACWIHLPMTVGERIAPLIGARPGEVAVGDSTSVDIFKALSAALDLQAPRTVLLVEDANFPTDGYIAEGLARHRPGVTLRRIDPERDLPASLDDDVAALLLSHVDYRTARILDMAAISAAARAAGVLTVWDLSHSTGAVPVDLHAADADFAIGCTYKYLNGGPGAPAFSWVHPRHHARMHQPLAGWFGHAAPFAFDRLYRPAEGMRRFVCGTPQILSLAALDESLKLWADVDRDALFAKSRAMTAFFVEAVEERCGRFGLALVSPRDPVRRGSHVSFDWPDGGPVMRALAERGVIGDFRAPATMRFGFAPLYLSFAEVARAVEILEAVLETRAWDAPAHRAPAEVT